MKLGLREPLSNKPNEIRLEAIEEFMDHSVKMEEALNDIYKIVQNKELDPEDVAWAIKDLLDKTFPN